VLRHLLNLQEPQKEQLAVFVVGLVTHLFADALMHPLIFYLTGPYDAPDVRRRTAARQDHRMLESLIDMCLTGGHSGVRRYSLGAYVRNSEMPLRDLHRHLEECWLRDEDTERFAEGLLSSFRFFAVMQFLYRSPLVGRLAAAAFPVVPQRVREVLSLFYSPGLMAQCWRIEGDIPYRHPSTGESRTCRIDGLFREAVNLSVAFCRGLEPLFRPGVTASSSWKLPPVDPSLSLDPEGPLRFFAPGRFFD
jgi:hypothetical protein